MIRGNLTSYQQERWHEKIKEQKRYIRFLEKTISNACVVLGKEKLSRHGALEVLAMKESLNDPRYKKC